MYVYTLTHILRAFIATFVDGWADMDVKYIWKVPDPVQFSKNMHLPGGFELDAHTSVRCDVNMTTGNG